MITHKGIAYFPEYEDARAAARQAQLPTDRIILYGRGWAIQLRVSGPYAGPSELADQPWDRIERILDPNRKDR